MTKAKETRHLENQKWKSVVPVLYDWFCTHHLVWPSLSCRWGPVISKHTYKTRQRIYLSEQTDGTVPNTLVVSNVEVVNPRVAAAEHINQWQEDSRSPFVKKLKTILHPGEVNRIRELPQDSNIVATHSDAPEVFVWNLETQPGRHAKEKGRGPSLPSTPDLTLVGHTANAEFALALAPSAPLLLSGGRDRCVVLWSLQDHITSLQAPAAEGSAGAGPTLQPRSLFRGHEDTVDDVQFRPSSADEFCSVGDDSALLFWDARSGTSPVTRVAQAHEGDVHCCDWNAANENYVITGSEDAAVKLFDRRKVQGGGKAAAVHTFEGHTEAVICLQWCPNEGTVFASGAEDGTLNVWDMDKAPAEMGSDSDVPPGLLFKHLGHNGKVVDFQWSAAEPWTMLSTDDGEVSGGSSLQMWRMNDLIHRPEEEALAEIREFREQ